MHGPEVLGTVLAPPGLAAAATDRRAGRPTLVFIPRAPRSLQSGGVFHATTRGVAKSAIYGDDDDRLFFLRLLLHVVRETDWTFHALCLMTNHYHLVVETELETLSLGMHWLNGTYALAYNRKYERWGHLFGDRFWSRVVEGKEDLEGTCDYVVQNPVRAGLLPLALPSFGLLVVDQRNGRLARDHFLHVLDLDLRAARKSSALIPDTRPSTVSAIFVIPSPG